MPARDAQLAAGAGGGGFLFASRSGIMLER